MSATAPFDFDIAVVGGGLVGAAFAALAAAEARIDPRRILLLERDWPVAPTAGAPLDLRVSAISRASRQILERCGAWARLDASRLARYERMQIWHEGIPPESDGALTFDAAQIAQPDLGCMAENRAIQSALLEAFRDRGGQCSDAALQALRLTAAGATLVAATGEIRVRLVVGADGAQSKVRDWAGIGAVQSDYGQRAIVATIDTQTGSRDTAWQCFLPTGPLALLPLPGSQCSIVWSAVDAEAQRLMALSPAQFDVALTRASDSALGELHLASERVSFPLRRASAERYVTQRCALIGDAAHVIHPLAGQGVNQGFLDAAELCAQIAARPPREDPGALRVLRRYERERRSGNALMAAAVDRFDKVFTGGGGLTGELARAALGWVNRSTPLKAAFMRVAAGRSSPRR